MVLVLSIKLSYNFFKLQKNRNCLNFMNASESQGSTKFKSGWGKVFFLKIYLEGILEGAMGAMSVIIIHCVLGERRNGHKSIP